MTKDNPFGDNPFGDNDPFGAMSEMFNQLFSQLGGGGINWESAKAIAASTANEGSSEANIDPSARMSFEQLGRAAELAVSGTTDVEFSHDGGGLEFEAVNRSTWTSTTIDDYKGLFTQLAGSLGEMMRNQLEGLTPDDLDDIADQMPPQLGIDPSIFLGDIDKVLGPIMLPAFAGSTVGQMGRRAFGSYDLPIPRPEGSKITIVSNTVDSFGKEWDIPTDEVRLWVCLLELAHHAVLSIPHVRDHLNGLLSRHASGFGLNNEVLEQRMSEMELDTNPEAMTEWLSDPELVLGAMRSEKQLAVLPHIDAIVTVIEGYVDWVAETAGTKLLGNTSRVAEALRRRRVETDQATRFVEQLFGLELTLAKLDEGHAFVSGIADRGGADAVAYLWKDIEHLPTPAELKAPGLWMARVGIDDQGELPELESDPEIPDFLDELDQ